MARRSLPACAKLWQRHETIYCEVFFLSLRQLVNEPVSGDENTISKRLCLILGRVCFTLSRSRSIEVRTPTWEGPIQPVSVDESEVESKRPDFTCKLSNPYATSAEEYEIPLHVECKRLGFPTSSSWKLNKNYVTEGMKRFDCDSHEYGKRASSGMMIGYIIDMEPEEILEEVNRYKQKHLSYFPDISMAVDKATVSRNRQNLKRKNVAPKEFGLTHLWVDLRQNYQS
jgi:hypothetical protein